MRGDPGREAIRRGQARGPAWGQSSSVGRGRSDPRRPKLPVEVSQELEAAAGHDGARRLQVELSQAAKAFDAERYDDARRGARKVMDAAPSVAAARELYALSLYKLGRFKDAARQLEVVRSVTGSLQDDAALADCYRALAKFDKVEEVWMELRQASPSGAAVIEGALVAAGARADQGDLSGAIRILERARKPSRRLAEHHLRLWYGLADLYERAGEVPRARELFGRLVAIDPSLFDSAERLAALS